MWIRSTCVLLVMSGACSGSRPATTQPAAIPLIEASASASTPLSSRDDLTPPWTLTASDGSGLRLTRVDAKAVVEGPLAFTELHLYFRNTEDRVREGTFQILLPERAAISRFAMEHAGQWMEAEVVAKLVARRAYDDFLHRGVDPALLEKAAGNQFTAKVFPIAANADKHLVISYSQELPGAPYELPLRGLPKVERVDVELAHVASDGTRRAQFLTERDWTADRDFVAIAPSTVMAVASGRAIAAQLELGGGIGREAPTGMTVFVDTSASRSLGYARYLAKVRELVGDLGTRWGAAMPIAVVAFDQDTQLIYDGQASGFGEAHVRALVERGAAGASDLGQALDWTRAKQIVHRRVLVIGDGVITAGVEDGALEAKAKQLGVERVDVALIGGLRDERAARSWVTAGTRAGAVLDLETDDVASAVGESVLRDVAIEVPGASWVYPRTIASARAGSKVMVFAHRDGKGALEVIAGGKRQSIQVVAGTAPLVERAVAGAEIAELEGKRSRAKGDELAPLRTLIATKSVAARVLSSETSMLVLETDADYARYGIDRNALNDVIVIGPQGIEVRHRKTNVLPGVSSRPTVAATREPIEAIGAPVVVGRSPLLSVGRESPTDGGSRLDPDDLPDQDRDGIFDVDDRCPSEIETLNGSDDDDGCPDRGRVVVTDSSIVILEAVFFEIEKDLIKQSSYPVLDAVAASLLGNPEIQLLEIGGHTDATGDDERNLRLSDRRAEAVQRYLVAKGVDRARLTTQGYGETQPIDPRDTPAAWARNRRVEFLILKRAADPSTTPAGTTPAAPPAPRPPPPPPPAPIVGELAAIQQQIAGGQLDAALQRARDWHHREPGSVLALIGLGEVLEAKQAPVIAARIYGSIIDLFPGRAELRRFAAERLARLANANELAIDSLRRAVADRPDHMTGHRLLAHAYIRAGKHAEAFDAILAGIGGKYRDNGYAGGLRVLGDDAAMIGAAYAHAVPAKRKDIAKALAERKLAIAAIPSLRFVLHWETDANDVDLHVDDVRGNHAYYRAPKLRSGGELYADVTTGFGPECFAIQGRATAGPYKVHAKYFSQGPMGFGMGLLEVVRFDGKTLRYEHVPYVVMNNDATLHLGSFR